MRVDLTALIKALPQLVALTKTLTGCALNLWSRTLSTAAESHTSSGLVSEV
jgi:hypothetical protein